MKFILGIMMLFLPLIFTAQISLNELSAKGGVVNMGENEDWLEIINTGSESIFLADYYLSDNADDLQKWNMPAYTLTPGEILLVLASGNNVGSGSGVWQSFVLAENTWKYLPGKTNMITGLFNTSFGFGAFMFTYIASKTVNPKNLEPSVIDLNG